MDFSAIFSFLNGLFTGLYDFFNGLFSGLFASLNGLFSSLYTTIVNAVDGLIDFIEDIWVEFWDALKTFFTTIFKPILDLVDGILYLFVQAFTLVVLALKVVAAMFGVFISFASGLITTIISFASWSGSTQYNSLPGPIDAGFLYVVGLTNQMGLNQLPLVFAVFVWLLTGYGVFKIVGGR